MDKRTKDLAFLLKHADIQSVLDIKAFFGEVSLGVLIQLNEASDEVFIVNDKTPVAAFFVIPTDNGYNLFSIMTPKAYSNVSVIKDLFKELKTDSKIFAAIYTGNRKLYNVLKTFGFCESGNKKIGFEKKPFLLLERG